MNVPDRDDAVAEKAYDTYFRHDESVHIRELKPYIKEVVQEVRKNSPPLDHDNILDKLESGFINMRSEKDVDQLNTIIAKSIDKAFEHQKNESKKKWTKKQSAYLAAATSILSSAITFTAFLVSANNNSCN